MSWSRPTRSRGRRSPTPDRCGSERCHGRSVVARHLRGVEGRARGGPCGHRHVADAGPVHVRQGLTVTEAWLIRPVRVEPKGDGVRVLDGRVHEPHRVATVHLQLVREVRGQLLCRSLRADPSCAHLQHLRLPGVLDQLSAFLTVRVTHRPYDDGGQEQSIAVVTAIAVVSSRELSERSVEVMLRPEGRCRR